MLHSYATALKRLPIPVSDVFLHSFMQSITEYHIFFTGSELVLSNLRQLTDVMHSVFLQPQSRVLHYGQGTGPRRHSVTNVHPKKSKGGNKEKKKFFPSTLPHNHKNDGYRTISLY